MSTSLRKPAIKMENNHLPILDPLMADLERRHESYVEHVWVDPIVVNETAGWLMLLPEAVLSSHVTPKQSCGKVPSLTNKPINTRGRPRKINPQPGRLQKPPQSSSKSSLEAQKTWNTAKLLGISSNNESAFLTGLRKSKRILILEGKSG